MIDICLKYPCQYFPFDSNDRILLVRRKRRGFSSLSID